MKSNFNKFIYLNYFLNKSNPPKRIKSKSELRLEIPPLVLNVDQAELGLNMPSKKKKNVGGKYLGK